VEQVGTPTELLTEPANEFVQSFVRKVNRFDVLTVGDIMHPVAAYTEKSMGDGAIRIHFETNAAQYVSLVSDAWEPLAWVYRCDALSGGNIAVNRVDPVPTVSSGTTLGQAIAVVLRATSPVAVLDDGGRLAGALDGNVLARAIQGDRPGCAGQFCRRAVRRVA
jgi:glycine betaine/proline transport system ATP-binding protein